MGTLGPACALNLLYLALSFGVFSLFYRQAQERGLLIKLGE